MMTDVTTDVTHRLRNRWSAAALAAVAMAAGCSSSARGAHAHRTTTTASTAAVSDDTARQQAQAAADALLRGVALPPDAVRATGPLPPFLDQPPQRPALVHLLDEHREWAVRESKTAVLAFARAHVPSGFRVTSSGSLSHGAEVVLSLVSERTSLPPNIGYEAMTIEVTEQPGEGCVIRIDALVNWTEPKPASELVPRADAVVIVSEYRGVARPRLVARRIVSDAAAVRALVTAFDALRVEPIQRAYHCPEIDESTPSSGVAFSASAGTSPNIDAHIGPCGGVRVTVHGHAEPTLAPNPTFSEAIRHALQGVPVLDTNAPTTIG